ncbi:anti-sigma F factor [Desulfitobacterium sp.]|uniref:anti-sigma F factor n=1 Tax=Desulfitobacterium sp. TaxID=49981 RepID=UPI002BC71959|nr:anti-sigma F factor [Desulfitobacterium sp.]HVJ48398.1 anti-sigma F factor [Desulfitobacterium sp.]
MKKNKLALTFSSIAENVSIARMLIASIAAQLDLSLNDIEELKVVVSEAVSNAIIHGYQNDPNKLVILEIEYDTEALQISVRDQGCGIPDVEQAMQPAYSTDPERMGLGFVFMQSFMDELNVDSVVNQGTTITMVKDLNKNHASLH